MRFFVLPFHCPIQCLAVCVSQSVCPCVGACAGGRVGSNRICMAAINAGVPISLTLVRLHSRLWSSRAMRMHAEMTCTDMAAMHACKHPEDGYLISASCKKSCNQCSTGCAAAATTAADQVATGAADDDDDDDGDDDGSVSGGWLAPSVFACSGANVHYLCSCKKQICCC